MPASHPLRFECFQSRRTPGFFLQVFRPLVGVLKKLLELKHGQQEFLIRDLILGVQIHASHKLFIDHMVDNRSGLLESSGMVAVTLSAMPSMISILLLFHRLVFSIDLFQLLPQDLTTFDLFRLFGKFRCAFLHPVPGFH